MLTDIDNHRIDRLSWDDMNRKYVHGLIDQLNYEAYNLLWNISSPEYDKYRREYPVQRPNMAVVIHAWEHIRITRYNGAESPKITAQPDYSHWNIYTIQTYTTTGKCVSYFNGKRYAL